MPRIEAHPDAAIFPMMSADELAELAADIKENGQRFPIIIGTHENREVIVDGRNRYEACEMAGVEPKFEKLNGHDPKAFILSVNINRRHMTVGQRAMAVAMIYPTPARVRRAGSEVSQHQVHKTYLSKARALIANAPDLAKAVLAGQLGLEAAHDQYQVRARASASDEAMLSRLRSEAPDLADLVTEERLQLHEAIRALDARLAEAKRQQETATRVLQSIFNALYPRSATPEEWADSLTKDVREEFWSGAAELTHQNLRACAHVMQAISKRLGWKEERE